LARDRLEVAQLADAIEAAGEMIVDSISLASLESIKAVRSQLLTHIVATQNIPPPGRISASSADARSFCIASRRRVLTVPSGRPRESAISTRVMPRT